MAKINWYYEDIGYNKKEAEEKILRSGFKVAEGRGYEMKLKKNNNINASRLHQIPCGNYYNLHIDNKQHHVVGGEKRLKYLKAIIKRLNKTTLKEKIIFFFRKL